MEKKQGFFRNAWTSIREFEKYEEFAANKVVAAIKYILILTLIFTVLITVAYTLKFYDIVKNAREYISENVEEIKIENGKLKVSSDEPIIVENENSIIPIIIVDTSNSTGIEEYIKKINLYDAGILITDQKIVISNSLFNQDESIYFSNIFTENIASKEEFLNIISGSNMMYTYILFFGTIFVYLFIVYIASNLVDGVILGVLGYLFARIVKLRLKYKATFNIGLHALTLPILLNLIYIIVNTFTNFKITYFQWMYTTISYIYVAVAILMIKTEIINQKIQLIKLQEIQEEVAKEDELKEEEREENKEKKEEKKEEEEKDSGEQPEGSNA